MYFIPVISTTIILAWELSSAFLFDEHGPKGPNATFLDYFLHETLVLNCLYHSKVESSSSLIHWNFYGYTLSKRTFYPNNLTYIRVEVRNTSLSSQLLIENLEIGDSGRYDCVTDKIEESWKVNVHDPTKMEYVFSARGQTPWENTTVSRFTIALQWTPWIACDGCGGKGERRRFGFCYVTLPSGKAHCNSQDVPHILRPVAKSRREEILVDVCYDQCVEHGGVHLVQSHRVNIVNGADLRLTCRKNASVRASTRWERDIQTLRRSDVCFGYAASRSVYLNKNNQLLLHKISLPHGGTISHLDCLPENLVDLNDEQGEQVYQGVSEMESRYQRR
ncbi:Ig-like V-type domain-containing protein FAM187A isoform X2 [Clavelina lepadiformis]|uniref:Ig-like V-type domain-containing protein FAM187A isoform X2 n=1 Tax=Clavelina lepadiformis TaxID=159417 RepID=UPI004041C75F